MSNLESVGKVPSQDDPTGQRAHQPALPVADKGYHARDGLKDLEDSAWKSRIAEPKPNGILRWKGDGDAKRAYDNNRARLLSGVARQACKPRAELIERSFAGAAPRYPDSDVSYRSVSVGRQLEGTDDVEAEAIQARIQGEGGA